MFGGSENSSLKLSGVVGFKGRQNDVIYCHPLEKSEQTTVVIYFGGDIQVTIPLFRFPQNKICHFFCFSFKY